MEKSYIANISDFLGKEETRYFANGFRFMNYEYCNVVLDEMEMSCQLYIDYSGRCNNISEKCHLGAIEYVSIASTLCETLVTYMFSLNEKELERSWIYFCDMKVSACTYINKNEYVKLRCRFVEVNEDPSSINGFKSQFEVLIGGVSIKMGVDHLMSSLPAVRIIYPYSIEHDRIYVTGYKDRKHIIRDLHYSLAMKVCSASLGIDDYYKKRKGLGVFYPAFIIPDIINISGQLAQVLLYKLENIARQEANNMWLREFTIDYGRPFENTQCEGVVSFSRFDAVVLKGDKWRVVSFSSQIGGIFAQFKIAHKLSH